MTATVDDRLGAQAAKRMDEADDRDGGGSDCAAAAAASEAAMRIGCLCDDHWRWWMGHRVDERRGRRMRMGRVGVGSCDGSAGRLPSAVGVVDDAELVNSSVHSYDSVSLP